jgi:3-deoxy-manno-octulosonate cytidylyltransferase (CMP-KDO synthetase)
VKAAAILPARLQSTRLPRKMLLADTGRPLIEHAARNALHTGLFERVAVATDSEEIRDALSRAGIDAVMTRVEHQSGTDRVLEAAERLGLQDYDVLVNVQGDEPEVAREDLARLVDAFRDREVEFATLCLPFAKAEQADSPQAVKVVRDARGDALYFSRAPIPDSTHARRDPGGASGGPGPLRHVGVYAFRPRALAEFCALPVGRLERLENLEQLRWLEAGRKLRVLDAAHAALGIDTRAEYDAFVARCKARGTT